MPLASMSNVTSICGTPRGAGGMPSRWNRPSVRLSRAIGRSPCSTWTSTDGLVVGGRGERSRSSWSGSSCCAGSASVMTPPSVSMPSDSGVTSSSTTSLTSPASTAGLDGRADRHHLVRVHALVRLLAEELLDRPPGPSASGSGRRPGRPRRCRSAVTPASFIACRQGSTRPLDRGRRPAPRAWPG